MLDTTLQAAKAQAAAYRRLGAERRFEMACSMSDSVRELARTRIRRQNPGFDEDAVQRQLVWELYGLHQR